MSAKNRREASRQKTVISIFKIESNNSMIQVADLRTTSIATGLSYRPFHPCYLHRSRPQVSNLLKLRPALTPGCTNILFILSIVLNAAFKQNFPQLARIYYLLL
ncbi:hypothetical protein RRG08_061693 [Elysia crispata]|uniref:Uncharacterized protein n=1 Tax=Elysia crispata TaxID=231223 RepID=A0AAE0XPI7_9GAST|nr:hypothetical protein RRG08_061693 [Elysia crispata]